MSTSTHLRPVVVAGDQTVVAITPENGGSLTEAPAQVELTYVRALDGSRVSATTSAPDSDPQDAQVEVDGSTVVVPVTDAGAGQYTVSVTVDGTTSTTAYTVLAPGEEVPEAPVSSGPLVIGLVLAALLAVAVLTVRRWFRR